MASGAMADHILKYDKIQGGNGSAVNRGIIGPNTEGKRCPEHGNLLTVHGSGNGMLCLERLGFDKGELKLCDYAQPIAL